MKFNFGIIEVFSILLELKIKVIYFKYLCKLLQINVIKLNKNLLIQNTLP